MNRRAIPALAAVTAAPVWSGQADAYEFSASWGRAQIDDNPFIDPATGQVLPANKAFPRGRLRDEATDGHRARLRVLAFSARGGNALASYFVDEYHAVFVPFDRMLDVGTAQIRYLRYDFCRVEGANDPTPECLPSPPPPPPTPVVQIPQDGSCTTTGGQLKLRLVPKRGQRRSHARTDKVACMIKGDEDARHRPPEAVPRRAAGLPPSRPARPGDRPRLVPRPLPATARQARCAEVLRDCE